MVSPRRRVLADRPRPARRQGTSKLGAVKVASPSGASSGATCGSQPTDAQPQASAQPQQPAAPRGEDKFQVQQRSSRPNSQEEQRAASALVASADAGFSDWGDSSFGFDSPAKPVSGRGAAGRSQPAKQQGPAKHGARPLSPNLLSHVQRGFRALIDGEAYVSERNHAASSRLQTGDQPDLPEPSFLNKGLDAFNAVSRAAVGVATTLDSQIEQLMEQHGWADNRPGSSGSSKVPNRSRGSLSGNDGSGQDSLLQLPSFEGFDSGATLFGGAAAAVVNRDSIGRVGGQQNAGRPSRQLSTADSKTAAKGKQVSPGVAEKMAALLPGFNHKDTVSEFLSEVQQVFGGGQLGLGSILSLEPAAAKGMPMPQFGGACDEPLAPPEWGDDSELFSSVFGGASRDSSSHEVAAASLAAQIQRVQHHRKQQKAPEAISQPASSPTANKENRGVAAAVAQPGAIDWQDFLSGDSQVLQPAAGSQAASMVSSGGLNSGSLSRQLSAQPQGCFSPPLPTTPPHNEAGLRRAETPWKQGEPCAARQQNECEKQLGVAASPAEAVQADGAEAAGAADGEPHAKAAEALAEPQLTEPTADRAYCGSPARPAAAHPVPLPPSPGTDPLSEQVRAQLEALVAEKSALAQENARLLRENTGLQELLSYTMHQSGDGAGSEIDSDDDDRLSVWSTMEADAMTLPSVENGESPVKKEKTSRRRLSMDSVEVSQNMAQLHMSTSDLDWAAAVPAADSIPAV